MCSLRNGPPGLVRSGWWLVAMSLAFPCALLQLYQDVEDEDTLKAVEAAVRESTSVKRIKVVRLYLNWTNVATAALKGATENMSLRKLTLNTPAKPSPLQDVVDAVKQKRRRLVVN